MLFWAIQASIPTKNFENKTVCVFFQGASDGNAKIPRNISQKLKPNEKLNFRKIEFSIFFVRIDAPMYFLEAATPGPPRKYTKNQIFINF